jgi:hypothetical protein
VAYVALKLAHILVAIFALGTGAAMGILLIFYADHPVHGHYVQGLVRKLLLIVVLPGYLLMLGTGVLMGHLAALLDARWTEAAMNLWGFGALFLGLMVRSLGHRKLLPSRLFGVGAALVIVSIVCLMVIKPA